MMFTGAQPSQHLIEGSGDTVESLKSLRKEAETQRYQLGVATGLTHKLVSFVQSRILTQLHEAQLILISGIQNKQSAYWQF